MAAPSDWSYRLVTIRIAVTSELVLSDPVSATSIPPFPHSNLYGNTLSRRPSGVVFGCARTLDSLIPRFLLWRIHRVAGSFQIAVESSLVDG